MSNHPSSLDRFFLNAQGLFDLIYDLVLCASKKGIKTVEPEIVKFAGVVIFTAMNKQFVIKKFIEKSYDHWQKIYHRDEKFFLDHAQDVFVGLPLEDVNAFRQLFVVPDALTEDDKETLWEFFESLIRISIIYLSEQPDLVEELDINTLEEDAKKWKLKI
jgi:hypothetical protein